MLALALLLAGCSSGGSGGSGGAADPDGLGRLGDAISAVSQARAAALTGAARPGAAASSLDRADAACATGERDRCRAARPRTPVSATATALRRLPEQVAAYGDELAELAAATGDAPVLTEPQLNALDRVVARGRSEVAALTALRREASRVWPAYSALDRLEATWLERRTAGWYRSTSEAANAYVVLTDEVRPPLSQARPSLSATDAALTRASRAQDQALAQADRALDALR